MIYPDVVCNPQKEQIFFAYEESSCCCRCCLQQGRPFIMHLTDNSGANILRFERALKVGNFCCPCKESHRMEIVVYNAQGDQIIGFVREDECGGYSKPVFNICDSEGQVQAQLIGGCWTPACASVEFRICDPQGTQWGSIRKEFSGICKELGTDADNFDVKFPADLHVFTKATVIAAVLLVDFTFFESGGACASQSDGSIVCHFGDLWMCGCLCPVKCVVQPNQGS